MLGVPLHTPREFPMEPGGREYRWASYGVNDLGEEVEEVDYMSQFNKRFNKVRANMLIFMSVYTIIVCFVMFYNFSPCVRLVAAVSGNGFLFKASPCNSSVGCAMGIWNWIKLCGSHRA